MRRPGAVRGRQRLYAANLLIRHGQTKVTSTVSSAAIKSEAGLLGVAARQLPLFETAVPKIR
jgi:hypothetical protein